MADEMTVSAGQQEVNQQQEQNSQQNQQPTNSSEPVIERPQSLTADEVKAMILEVMGSQKQSWLDESYRNAQSMTAKFEDRVNKTVKLFEEAGVNISAAQAAKVLRTQEQQERQEQQQTQAQRPQYQPITDPNYAELLNRFNVSSDYADSQMMKGAYALERELNVKLETSDPEYNKYFVGADKQFTDYTFQRQYEKALLEKQKRLDANNSGNPAALPSFSGNGATSPRFNSMSRSEDMIAFGLEEARNNRRK